MTRKPLPWSGILVFALLIAIGVAGRLGQPVWGFTPIAAAAILAGALFGRAVAATVPMLTLLVTDLVLTGHDNLPVMLTVYAAMATPVVLGPWLFGSQKNGRGAFLGRLAFCGVAPATLFFFATNLAVWQFRSDYAPTLAGLAECYSSALPFYRQMLLGDLLYVPLLCGAAALTGIAAPAEKQRPAESRAGL